MQYSKYALKYILYIFSSLNFIKRLAFFLNTYLPNEGRNKLAHTKKPF